jgi:hypothetical protein
VQATFGPESTTGGEPGDGTGTGARETTSDASVDGDVETDESGLIETCSNGIVEPPEECDDENEDLCDGCEDCRIRTSVVLDGQSSLIEIDDVDDEPLALLSTPFTVEAWMRIDDPGDAVDLLRRGSGNSGWRVSMNEGGLIGTVFNGFDHIEDGMTLPGTGWHHVAWSYDLTTSRLFLDGALVGTMTFSAPVLEPDQPMRIGAWVGSDGIIASHRRGRVDEVRVSSTVRYVSDFTPQRRFEPDGPTLLLLHLDEGGGVTVHDASLWDHVGGATAVEWEPEDGYGIPEFCE